MRGLVGVEIDEAFVSEVGGAFARLMRDEVHREGQENVSQVVVGHDMRPSSPGAGGRVRRGRDGAGADVVMIGLASTDQLYFASGHSDCPGAMFTASHNPAAVQRHQAVPGRRRAGRPGDRAGDRDPAR